MPRPNPHRRIQAEANLARRLELERQQRGWSYEALAKEMTAAGCPIQGSALYKIERGDPPRRVTVDELVALGEVLGETPADLLQPIELIRRQRAQQLVARADDVNKRLAELAIEAFQLRFETTQLQLDDEELATYVAGHSQAHASAALESTRGADLGVIEAIVGFISTIQANADARARGEAHPGDLRARLGSHDHKETRA